MTNLQGKVVVVTGAAGGMGRAIVRMLVEAGAKLALADHDADGLKEVAEQSGAVMSDIMDVTDETQVAAFFGKVKETYGHADVLVNLPGVSIPAKIAEMTVEDYDRIVDVNVKGSFLCAKYFVPLVDPEIGGQVLYTSSMAAGRANPNAPVYCAAKAAVSMLADGLALQVKDQNIRVTALRPGPTDTDGFWGDRPVPREKFMQTRDIAQVVRFILELPEHVVVHEIAFESFTFFKR